MHALRISPFIIALSFVFATATASAQNKPDPKKKDVSKKKDAPKKKDPKKPDAKKKDAAKKDAPKKGAPKKDAAKKDDAKKAPSTPPAPKKPAAPTKADIEKAKGHFLKGRELFDAKKFDLAIKEFKSSYRLSRNAMLLYNVAFTLENLKQKQKALFYYKKFLTDAPAAAPNRDHAMERGKKLARELDADAIFAPQPKVVKTTTTKDPPVRKRKPTITKFMHNVIEDAPPGYPLDITAFIPEGARWQVTLFYRGANEAKFSSVNMKLRYSELVGRIPKSKMAGRSVQYYIEVRDRSSKITARSGRSNSPHLVYIDSDAKPRYYPDLTHDPSRVVVPNNNVVNNNNNNNNKLPKGDGGWSDVTSSKFRYAKWGSTISAAGFVTMAVSFYFLAAQKSASLEGEAFASTTTDQCPFSPPCRSYSDIQKDLESSGKQLNTLTNVTMVLGVVSAGVAGYFWWKEMQAKKKRKSKLGVSPKRRSLFDRVVAVPVIGRDVVGGGAALRF